MKKEYTKTNKLTFMGVMLALTIVFVFATLIPNPASASIAVLMFLPTILTGVLFGPKTGAIMGLCAGVASLLRATIMPMSLLDPFFMNPLISVLPRILVGFIAGLVFLLLHEKLKLHDFISSAVAAAMGMLTNTVLVIGMLYAIYSEPMVDKLGMGFITALGVIFLSNGIWELVSAAVIIPIIYATYKRYSKMK